MKNSIKRAQSQACLGFAERKNFRPLAKHLKKLTLTLALLITAVGGAWAEDYTTVFELNGSTANVGNLTLGTSVETGSVKIHVNTDEIAGIQINADYNYEEGQYFTIAPETGSFKKGDKLSIAVCFSNSYDRSVKAVIYADDHGTLLYTTAEGINGRTTKDDPVVEEYVLTQDASVLYIGGNSNDYTYVTTLKVERPASADPTIDVTWDAATRTSSFTMPAYDVTASYTLKRDMSVDMPVTVQDKEQNSRFRVQKQGNSFVPVGLTNEQQIVALFTVHDDIEKKNLTANTDYTVQLFAVDEEGQKTGEAIPFNDFTFAPGSYVAVATAVEGSNYSGETAVSNVFTLFQGYEVEVPAGEYITYYKDEALKVEDEDAQLYTITAVSGTTATAQELNIAPANTPILVKNNSTEKKTILLIPTTEEADNVTVYSGFKGTLEAATITASDDYQDNYAWNGLQFVWVKDAIDIAANKAWLEVTATASAAPQIRLIFSSATGIERVDGGQLSVDSGQLTVDGWYSLDGRRLPGKPGQKGVYIVNGKKVVIK